MRRPAAVALACFCAASCGAPLAPLPTDGSPRVLAYQQGGFVNYATDVRLAGDTVVLTSTHYGNAGPVVTVTRRVPSAEEWRGFWQAAREAGVRRWASRCVDNSAVDGGGFSFELAWADARRAGSYSNAYPTRAGGCSTSDYAAAQRFQQAVLGVAGVVVAQIDRGAVRAP